MNRKKFLQTTSALAGGIILADITACNNPQKITVMNEPLVNWAGNLTYGTSNVYYPKTVEEVQAVVKQCSKLTALGSKHSFNTIANNTDNLISLRDMNKILSLNKAENTITIEAGLRYGDFAPFLDEQGYALGNLASLPHITVSGACATGTHGSGITKGNLSTAVTAIEFVNAAGDVINLSRQKDGDLFNGAVVHLGAMGIVTKLTLDLVPTFKMQQLVYLNMPIDALKDNFADIQSKGYSISLFTDWQNKNINEVWIKSSVSENDATVPAPELYGALPATKNMHPIASESAENVTDQVGVPGAWYERMPHFKMGFKPSAGKELQAEYFVPAEHAYDAIMAIETLHEKITPHLFISEIRTIKADELWMSPCYKQTSVAIHFTWKQETEAVMNLLPQIEAQLAPFNVKPHWGKLFTMQPKVLQSRYEKLADFKKLVAIHDPNGKFRNEFLKRNVFGEL